MKEEKKEVIEYIKNAIKNGTTPAVMACNLSEIFARQFNESVAPQMPKRFKKVKAGNWEQPVMKGYKMKCCDCGLVHIVDFRIATSIHARRNKKTGLVDLERDGHVQLRMKRL